MLRRIGDKFKSEFKGGKQNDISSETDVNVQTSMRLPLIILQCFGFFPVQGISEPTYRSLKFSWISFRSCYAVYTFIFFILSTLAEIHKILFSAGGLNEISALIFDICGLLAWILFFKLAREWADLMREWQAVELNVKNFGLTTKLKKKLNILAITFLLAALLEHTLVKSYTIAETFKCCKTTSDALRHYFVNVTGSQFFEVVDYAVWKGFLLQVPNIQMTFSWTYVDVFIILMSVSFTYRLRQLRHKIQILLTSPEVQDVESWRKLRTEHEQLCRLCKSLDEKISFVVLLSYWTNLYFILLQLFGSLRYMKDALRKTYFYLSFLFLIVRMACTCLYGASINDESLKIIPLVLTAPDYNCEVQRFVDQAVHVQLAISGKGFFKITRGLILKIAGAVVTYELVMIQFNANLLEIDDEGHRRSQHEEQPKERNGDSYWLC